MSHAHPRRASVLCAIAMMIFAHPFGAAVAQEVDAEQAFQSLPSNSWYNKKTKDFIPPKISQEHDNPLRSSGWRAKEKAPKQPNANNSNWNWVPNLSGLSQAIPAILFSLMAVVLVIVLALLTYYAFRNYMPVFIKRNAKKAQSVDIDLARVVDLPFEVKATQNNPLAEAERLMQLGRYDEAIVFLYGYQLLALDQARRIHLQKGKTNRMYVGELRSYLRLRQILEMTMLTFEAFFFGKHPVTREQFMRTWQQVDEFHTLLNNSETPLPAAFIAEAATT